MRILIAGGTGFLGARLARELEAAGHEIWVLTRQQPHKANEIQWDGRSAGTWVERLAGTDAVVNVTGFGLNHWPWTARQKQRFVDSRVLPGAALASAIGGMKHPPKVLLQISGVHYYGATGDGIADESWPAESDYLAQMAVQWEAATRPVEEVGVRHVVARSGVVLEGHEGLFPLMALSVRLFAGGPLGTGKQAVPWIHIKDEIAALRFLLEKPEASGPFNLVAPEPTSNADFMRAVARAMHRPYWFPMPAFLMRIALGEMSILVLDGRYCQPRRLTELGFRFSFPSIGEAACDMLERRPA